MPEAIRTRCSGKTRRTRMRVTNVTTFARSAHSIRVGAAGRRRAPGAGRSRELQRHVHLRQRRGSRCVRQSGRGRRRRAERDLRSRPVPPRAGRRARLPPVAILDRQRRPGGRTLDRRGLLVRAGRLAGGVAADDLLRHTPRAFSSYDGLRMRFAPRAGLAWAPSADGNSAVRAGVGVFYTPIPHRLFSDALRLDGRHGQRLVVDRPEFFPGVPDALPGVQDLTATIRTQSPDLTMPMTLVSTVSYDRRLVGSLFGSIGYTWRRGTDLLRTRNIGVSGRRHHGPECPDPAVRVDGAFERSRSQRHRERHVSART